jgi:gamma-glutamylputrescine oxidase
MSSDYPDSYYAATAVGVSERERLRGRLTADVCIVGGGYTGLSAALHLARSGYQVVVLEANRIGWGASGRNGGQVGVGQRRGETELVAMFGLERARALWQLGRDATGLVRTLISRHAIDCDLSPGQMVVAAKSSHIGDMVEEVELLRARFGYRSIRMMSRAELESELASPVFDGGWLDDEASHLHPLNYCLGLGRAAEEAGAQVFEHSAVIAKDRTDPALLRTEKGEVSARYLLLACNGYLGGLEPRLAGKIMPINNFVVATESLGAEAATALIRNRACVHDTRFVVNYFRLSRDHRLIFGGGENYRTRFPRDIAAFVRPYMLRIFPQLAAARIDYAWGGTLAITLNRLPCIGRLAPNIFYAQGYSGHGVPMATLAGQLVAEALAGTAERFDLMAGIPQPKFPGGTLLRHPALVLGMLYYALRDRL